MAREPLRGDPGVGFTGFGQLCLGEGFGTFFCDPRYFRIYLWSWVKLKASFFQQNGQERLPEMVPMAKSQAPRTVSRAPLLGRDEFQLRVKSLPCEVEGLVSAMPVLCLDI